MAKYSINSSLTYNHHHFQAEDNGFKHTMSTENGVNSLLQRLMVKGKKLVYYTKNSSEVFEIPEELKENAKDAIREVLAQYVNIYYKYLTNEEAKEILKEKTEKTI